MKGVILAGGSGTRLFPLTKITNKHLLPVYNKPMIYYPIESLVKAGIKDIMIVSGKGHAGHFLELLGSGREFGANFSYAIQEEAGGIAQALDLAKDFIGTDKVIVVLGDNILEDDISKDIEEFKGVVMGARVFLKKVKNPSSYGIAQISNEKIVNIVEKPKDFIGDLAVVGVYMYDNQVWDIINTLKPSGRGELEITDVNNFYVKQGTMTFGVLNGWWADCGESIDTWLDANNMVANKTMDILSDDNKDEIKNIANKVVEQTLRVLQEETLKSTKKISEEKKDNVQPEKKDDQKFQHPFDINSYYSK